MNENSKIIKELFTNMYFHLEKFIYYFNHEKESEEYKLFPMAIHLFSFMGCLSKVSLCKKQEEIYKYLLKLKESSTEESTNIRNFFEEQLKIYTIDKEFIKKSEDFGAIKKIVKKKEFMIESKDIDKLRELRNDILHNYYLKEEHNKIDYDKLINIFINFIEGTSFNKLTKKKYLKKINKIEDYKNTMLLQYFLKENNLKYNIFELSKIYDKTSQSIEKQDKDYKIIKLLTQHKKSYDEFEEYISNLLKKDNNLIIELYEKLGFTKLLKKIMKINDVDDIKKIYEEEEYTNLWEYGSCDFEYCCPNCGFGNEYILSKVGYDSSHLEYLEKQFRCIKCNIEFSGGVEGGECNRCGKLTDSGWLCEDCEDWFNHSF
ncbi:MAG: hypothetical protein LBH40_03330 [Alphaproteobacteria bacterium]|jgi:hypothetical protein|nr:hypothetical protein [Alphaproteobacteria bacterium]